MVTCSRWVDGADFEFGDSGKIASFPAASKAASPSPSCRTLPSRLWSTTQQAGSTNFALVYAFDAQQFCMVFDINESSKRAF